MMINQATLILLFFLPSILALNCKGCVELDKHSFDKVYPKYNKITMIVLGKNENFICPI